MGPALEKDCAQKLGKLVMAWGQAAATCFSGEGYQTRALLHRGDFAVAWPKKGAVRVKKNIVEFHEVKARAILGRQAEVDKDVVVLGGAVRWTTDGGRVGSGREAHEIDQGTRTAWSFRWPRRGGRGGGGEEGLSG